MNQTDGRIIIRDTNGYKLYEIHHKEVPPSGLDYLLDRKLTEEEASQLVLEIINGKRSSNSF